MPVDVGANPEMDEVCGNSVDEDCSGSLDDKDVDGDGWVDTDPLCGGSDCNDDDPMIFPGAPEVRDGKDNDCDPDGKADEGLIAAGDLIVTEIFYDSSRTPDENYEWFEVFNPTDRDIDMQTWLLRDRPGTSQEIAVVNTPLRVPARGFATLCRTASSLYNGGVDCDYEYGFMQLANTADELILDYDGLVVDEVWYDEASWPAATSASLNLDPDQYFADNNVPAPWCEHPPGRSLPVGDYGTPGVSNVSCTAPVDDPQVVATHPDNGIAPGGTEVRIVGSGFLGVTDVQVGGSSCTSTTLVSDNEIRCTLPPGTPGPADVVVVEGAVSDTLSGWLTLTREASAGAELVDDAIVDRPATLDQVRDTYSRAIYVRVTEAGLTGSACPASGEYPPSVLRVEVGYGTLGTDPRTDGSWVFWPAFCDSIATPADEFKGTVTASVPGTYSFAARVSLDGGLSWNYVDLDGTANGFSTAKLGTMTVR